MTDQFDRDKDKLLYAPVVACEDAYNRLSVAIFSYGDTGKPKLQISREKCTKGEWAFAKLGRMSLPEFSAVARAAKEAFRAVENGTTTEAAPDNRK